MVNLSSFALEHSNRAAPKVLNQPAGVQCGVGKAAMDTLQITLGLLWLAIGGFFYAGQFISTVSFPLLQRLGLTALN